MKRIISIVLSCIMICALFVGCSNMATKKANLNDANLNTNISKINPSMPTEESSDERNPTEPAVPEEPSDELNNSSSAVEPDSEKNHKDGDDESEQNDGITEYNCDPHNFIIKHCRVATDTTEGYVEMICTRCGYIYINTIPANSDGAMMGDKTIVLNPVNEKYNYEIIRTSWSEGLMLSSGVLNHSAIAKGERQLPMYRFDTLSDASDFATRFGFLSLDAYQELVANYDESFFETQSLVLVYITAGSGTARFDISDIICDSGLFRVEIKQANDYEIGTCDMAGWFAVIEVDDKTLNDCVKFEAGFTSNTSGSELKRPTWQVE